MRTPASVLTIAASLLSPMVMAHDSFLLATNRFLTSPGRVTLRFVTTDTFPESDAATEPSRVASWAVSNAIARADITAMELTEKDLRAEASLESEGIHVAAIALGPRSIELDADAFNGYLSSEVAHEAIAHRRATATSGAPAREIYTKLAKTFIRVGSTPPPQHAEVFRSPVGHTLEIIPLSDPTSLHGGDRLRLRVVFEGRPLPGALVSTGLAGLPAHTYYERVRTDERGECAITIRRSALWFARTHVIRPIEPKAIGNGEPPADWESFWASITFEATPRPAGSD